MSESDVRITPQPVWQLVRELAGDRDICDVCTEPDNPLGAARFFTAQDNALTSRWATTVHDLRRTLYWGNVPYSRGMVLEFAKCFEGWGRFGLECLMLTQCDVSTGWFAFLREAADARCQFGERVQFLEPDGAGGLRLCSGGAKFGSCFWYWGGRRRRFARVFGAHGEVIQGLGPREEQTT